MTKRRWIIPSSIVAAVVLVAAAGGGVAFWKSDHQRPKIEPAPADPVAIAVPHAPRQLTIGVVVTLSSKPGQGSEWKYAAEGAQVAAQRLAMGGVQVRLKTVDDKGTRDGARQAVEQLAKDNVSGVVVASDGSHLRGAVEAAKDTGVPLLQPYESDPELLGGLSWSTGPTDAVIGARLAESMAAAGLSRPLVINAGGGIPAGVRAADELSYASGDDTDRLVRTVRKWSADSVDDCVLVSGPAILQATVVQALQGGNVSVPIFLTPDATSPAFATALLNAGGSLSTSLNSVGPDWDDAAALQAGAAGRAMSSFLTAVRLGADDDKQLSLIGDQPFSAVADQADVRSHDAVIALVQAAAAARSGTAADVAAAIPGLKLGHDAGLAGPDLDFTGTAALDPHEVVALRSSDQDLGLRPEDAQPEPRLIWFAAPTTS